MGPLLDTDSYPGTDNEAFDRDHAGVGGYTSGDLLAWFEAGALDGVPVADAVLLGIGGNDLTGGSVLIPEVVANIQSIIDFFQASNPNVTVFVEQIAPPLSTAPPSLHEKVVLLNTALLAVPPEQSTASSHVALIDMATEWMDG
ncbi:MAG: lysophospholipase L1-like esterase [Planctomycetota bacterium]